MSDLTNSTEWQALQSHHNSISEIHMRDLFAKDPDRFSAFSVNACGVLPVSYTHLTLPTIYSV